MRSVISDNHFHDEAAAYEWVEARVWPKGPVCPHCGGVERISKMEGKSTRIGTYKCYQCRKPFTVKIGTIFEASHIPLRLWLQAIFLISSSKKGISANQLHRTLGITLKSAWFMGHRIREAMKDGGFEPLGGNGKTVEADETYFGGKRKGYGRAYVQNKTAVVSLVERGGRARSQVIKKITLKNLKAVLDKNLHPDTHLMTDEFRGYRGPGLRYMSHQTVNHSAKEYARGNVSTNTVEGFFSVFKRGMKGTYQHCAEKHLQRYLVEFDFRYNNRVALGVNDEGRAAKIVDGIVGKRLTYRTANQRD